MPSSPPNFKVVEKNCLECGDNLVLKTVRDIDRKNFCSRGCSNTYTTRQKFSLLPNKVCKVCDKEFKPTNYCQDICGKDCRTKNQIAKSYKYLNGNFKAYIMQLICKKGRENLTIEFMLDLLESQKGLCAVSEIPLTCIKIPNSKRVHTNLSIDRIDSTKGYELDNIQLVCAIVNVMKSNLSMTEFKWWIQAIQGGLQNS